MNIKRLYTLDSIGIGLFALILLGIVDHFPLPVNITIQLTYIAATIALAYWFLRHKIYTMVGLKIGMIAIVIIIDILALNLSF